MIKTIDEAIQHCKEVISEKRAIMNSNAYSDVVRDNCKYCISDHEQLVSWLEELKCLRKENQELRDTILSESYRWIPVSERLPEKDGRCLVSTDYGDVTMDSFVDGMFVCNLGNVTHWKPLPKAPESEAEKEVKVTPTEHSCVTCKYGKLYSDSEPCCDCTEDNDMFEPIGSTDKESNK